MNCRQCLREIRNTGIVLDPKTGRVKPVYRYLCNGCIRVGFKYHAVRDELSRTGERK